MVQGVQRHRRHRLRVTVRLSETDARLGGRESVDSQDVQLRQRQEHLHRTQLHEQLQPDHPRHPRGVDRRQRDDRPRYAHLHRQPPAHADGPPPAPGHRQARAHRQQRVDRRQRHHPARRHHRQQCGGGCRRRSDQGYPRQHPRRRRASEEN